MVDKRVNLSLVRVPSSLADNVTTRVAWMFSWTDQNVRKAVHAGKILVTGFTISSKRDYF